MSYIGRGVDAISNVEKLDNITFDGSTTYNLTKSSVAFTPSGANNILISIDGVVQQGNFSVAGATIIFDWSPTSSNTCNWIQHYGTGVLNVPADGTITAAKMAANSVDSDSYVDGSIDAVHMSANSIDSDSYVDGSIDLAHMSSESVDEDNLHISNAGSNDQFLQKQSGNAGGLTWAAAGGGLVLIWSQDTSAVSSIEKLNSFSATYDNYLLTYTNISFSADATDKIFIGNSGGYITANYAYGYFGVKSSATPWENSIGGNYGNMSSSFINSIDSASASEYGMTGQAWIHNPFQSGSSTFINGYSGFRNGSNDAWSTINYWWTTNSDASSDRIKFESSTGNFSTFGNYKLYGLVNS